MHTLCYMYLLDGIGREILQLVICQVIHHLIGLTVYLHECLCPASLRVLHISHDSLAGKQFFLL